MRVYGHEYGHDTVYLSHVLPGSYGFTGDLPAAVLLVLYVCCIYNCLTSLTHNVHTAADYALKHP